MIPTKWGQIKPNFPCRFKARRKKAGKWEYGEYTIKDDSSGRFRLPCVVTGAPGYEDGGCLSAFGAWDEYCIIEIFK